MKKLNLIFGLLVVASTTSFTQVVISDNIAVAGTWTLANSPYILEGRTIVLSGQTLTIEPGVEVRFKSSASPTPSWFNYEAGNVGVLRVVGEVIANGTPTQPIVFTRDNTGYWGTILIDDNASTATSFTNCIIEYANESRNVTDIPSVVSFNGGISVYKTPITLANNSFSDNKINGLYIREVVTEFDFSNNTIYDNGANGVVIEESIVNGINNSIYDNSKTTTGMVSAIRSSNSTVYLVGNLIYDNDDFGIFTTNGGDNYIINNTIYGNSQGVRVENGANTYIYNTIIQDNNLNFATSNPSGATIEMRNSLTDDALFPANISDLSGNIINSDALFSNTSIYDFTLQSFSPCIESGFTDTSGLKLPTLDIMGNDRVINNTVDIGALEFQNTVSAAPEVSSLEINVYPNPTTDFLYIQTPDFLKASVFSIDGREGATHKTPLIDVKNLSPGMYLLRVERRNGNTTFKKFIKK